jgi:uncharacterized protein
MPPTEIFDLIKGGDAQAVAAVLEAQPDLVYARNPEGISATLYAAYCRRPEVLALFTARNAQPDVFEAAATGNFSALEYGLLLDLSWVNALSPDGFSPLGLACFMGQLDPVRLLIAYGADVNQASNNALAVAPLHSAAAASDPTASYEMVDFLLQHDADPNQAQASGHTPLHTAAHLGRTEVAELLLQYGADPSLADPAGKTPADLAREAGFGELASLLDG